MTTRPGELADKRGWENESDNERPGEDLWCVPHDRDKSTAWYGKNQRGNEEHDSGKGERIGISA